MNSNHHLWKKAQKFRVELRRQVLDNQLNQKRSQFIRTVEYNLLKQKQQAHPQSDELTKMIQKYHQFNSSEVIEILSLIIKSPSEVINNYSVSLWLAGVANLTKQKQVVDSIKNILIKYIMEPASYIETEHVYHVLPIIIHMEYLEIWSWISLVQDYDVKRTALKYFNQLITSEIQQQNVQAILNICYQFSCPPEVPRINFYFYFPLLHRILSLFKLTSKQYVQAINILNFMIRDSKDVKVLILNKELLTLLGKSITTSSAESEITTSMNLLTQLFFHSESVSHEIMQLMGRDIILAVYQFFENTNKKNIQVACLQALSNIIANDSCYVVDFIKHNIYHVVYVYQNGKIEVKDEIIELIYVVFQFLHEEQVSMRVQSKIDQYFSILANHLGELFSRSLEKCLYSLLTLLKHLSTIQSPCISRVVGLMISNKVQNKLERLLTHKSSEVNSLAEQILDFQQQFCT